MKSTYYDQATVAYNAGDYPKALKGYYQCLKEDWAIFEPGDAGLIYHRIGNCLIKMKNLKDAATSYQKALQDDRYGEKTSIHVNLATTLNGIGKYADAITYFNKALSDSTYSTPYRAYMGLGNSYSKLGKYVEAGTAYRSAALDESNPNPVKALMSLGSTFTLLGRPADAVEAYLAILDFRVTGKALVAALEKLGQAYVAAGRYQEAIGSFEDALSREPYTLSPEAQEDYQKARRYLGLAAERSYGTGKAGDSYGADGLQKERSSAYPLVDFNEEEGYGAGNVPSADDTGFFTATDAELMETGRRQLRKERKLRHTGLKVFLGIIIVLILALGTCVIAYMQGVGIPSQQTVIEEFFGAHAAGESVDKYWIDKAYADRATFNRLLDGVAKSKDVAILSLESDMTEATVLADVKLSEGGIVHYQIKMARDGIGWKLIGIEMIFASVQQGSAQNIE